MTITRNFSVLANGAGSANNLSLGGATLGSNALAVTGTAQISSNVGLGLAASTNNAGYPALELVGGGILYSNGATSDARFGCNTYISSGTNTYKATAAASLYYQTSGLHVWYNAPSGTAGTTVSFTERARIDTSGNLCVGTTAATGRLNIGGGSIYNSTSGVGNTAGPVSITIPSDTDGFILLNAVQSGVGKVSYIIHYMNVSGTVTINTVSTLVTGTSPITAITPGTNAITLTLFAANTNVNWGIYNGPRG